MKKHILAKVLTFFVAMFGLLGVFWVSGTEVKAASYPSIMLNVPYYPQKASGDCGISSIAMIEAYSLGYDKTGFDSMYASVLAANGNSYYINSACSNGKYVDISMDLSTLYAQLAAGKPILIRREPHEHWSVIVGYNGSSTTLQKSGFVVWDTKRGVTVANYNEVSGVRRCSLTEWLKKSDWSDSANLVRARVRGTGAIGGGGSSGNVANYQVKVTGVSNVTGSSARINASLSPGANVSELGFYWGTDPNNMTKVVEKASCYVEGIWYDLGTGKWTGALNGGTTYYYQIYAVVGGTTYKSSVDSFKTASTQNSLVKNTGVTSIGETTARINASLSPGAKVSELGFFWGTSPNSMTRVVESTAVYVESIWYDLGTGKWTGALKKGTTYYYQIYAIINGTMYTSAIDNFTTAGDSVAPVISDYYVTDVSDNGYSVVCVVTDNVAMDRVSFPTWTEANGQDDLSTDWYNQTAILKKYAEGNTYTFRVLKSNHGNQTGLYNTHVYAYDTSGNYTKVVLQCGIYPLQSISLSASTATLSVGQTTQLTINYNPSNTTTSQAASWTSSNTNVVRVDNGGNVTAVSAGTAIITANVAGKTAQCTITVKAAEDANLTAFVERMYTVALGRTAEASGVNYWKNQLKSYQADGAGIARGFILGSEFTNKRYSNSKYIEILYKTFFDRTADASGQAYWIQLLNSGQSRECVLSGFVNSTEFSTICSNYGISRGYMQSNGVAINPGICRFAERLYTKVLGRAGEKEGMEYWAIQISGGACTPEAAAQGFFHSGEYKAKNTSNDAYIRALYATFMDRTPDVSGLSYWNNILNSGTSREAVLSGFANSAEFKQIMQSYGL